MQEKGFWDDIKRAEEVTKESKSIKDKIDRYESLVRRLDDVEVLAELAEDDEETINEVIIEIKDIEKQMIGHLCFLECIQDGAKKKDIRLKH